nr:nucleotide sugar dehydrogenase [Bailinhaonella thermotolerans]
MNVAVVGLGFVGSSVAAALVERGVDVVGVDTDLERIAELHDRRCRISEPELPELLFAGLDSGRLRVTGDYDAVGSAEVVIVAVGTPVREDGHLDDSQLRGAMAELAPRLAPDTLLICKSTVPPGGTRELVAPALERAGLTCGEDVALAFCPERLAEGRALRELREFPVVVSGYTDKCATRAAEFWQATLGVPVIPCSTLEAAELVKMADNWWIDHNIALANELAKVCGAYDVDVLDVIKAANSIPKGNGNVNILLPSVGVGGSCLVKDPWMIWQAARQRGIDLATVPVARQVNDTMPHYTVDLIEAGLRRLGKDPAGAKVAVLGLAFKNDTGDLRATPTKPVVQRLLAAGSEVSVYDPLAVPAEVTATFGQAPAATLEEAVAGADCLAVLAHHQQFHAIDFTRLKDLVAPSCLVIDGRAYYSREKIEELRRAGYTYQGIGR